MAEPAKKALLIALGAPKKGPVGGEPDGDEMGGPSDRDGDEPGSDDIKQMAADDAFDAIKSGDRALFADALDRYVKSCM